MLKFCFCGANYTLLFHWHRVGFIPIPAERIHSCPLNLRSENLIFFGFESQLEVGYVSFSFLYLCLNYVEHMKVLVTQLHPTFCNPMDCSLPGSSVHGIWGCHFLLQGTFPPQGLNSGLPHCRQILYHLSHQGNPEKTLAILRMPLTMNYTSMVTHKENKSKKALGTRRS